MFKKRFLFFWLFVSFASGIGLAFSDLCRGGTGAVAVSVVLAFGGIFFAPRHRLFFSTLLLSFTLGAVLLFAERFVYFKSAPFLNEPFSCTVTGTIVSGPRSFEVVQGKLWSRYITLFDMIADDVPAVDGLGGERIFVTLRSWSMPELGAGDRIRAEFLVEDVRAGWGPWLRGQPWLMASTRAGREPELLAPGKTSAVLNFRNKGLDFIERAVCVDSERFVRENAVLTAAVSGRRSEIDPMLRDSFIRTGTMHLIAISGLHFGLAVFFIWLVSGTTPLFRRFERTRILMCIGIALVYAFFLGTAYPSVFRACIFVSICFLARLFGRETTMLNVLGMAGLIILAVRPLELFLPGFELSFFIVFCLIVLNPFRAVETRWPRLQKHRVLRGIVRALCMSVVAWLAAQMIILPVMGQISFVGIFINPLAVCIFAFIMSLSFISVVLTLSCPPAAMVVKWLNVWCVRGLLGMIDSAARWPWSFAVIEDFTVIAAVLFFLFALLAAIGGFVFVSMRKYDLSVV